MLRVVFGGVLKEVLRGVFRGILGVKYKAICKRIIAVYSSRVFNV